jgi:hypothetical protein
LNKNTGTNHGTVTGVLIGLTYLISVVMRKEVKEIKLSGQHSNKLNYLIKNNDTQLSCVFEKKISKLISLMTINEQLR